MKNNKRSKNHSESDLHLKIKTPTSLASQVEDNLSSVYVEVWALVGWRISSTVNNTMLEAITTHPVFFKRSER